MKTFNFLGFTHICGRSRHGKFLLKRKSRRDRMRGKLKETSARSDVAPAESLPPLRLDGAGRPQLRCDPASAPCAVDGRSNSLRLEVRMVEHQHPLKALRRSSIFGPAPILPGEDPAAYDDLLAQVSSCLNPTDIVEEILLHDYVDLTWQIIRMRQLREAVIAEAQESSMSRMLEVYTNLDQTQIGALLKNWRAGEASAVKQVEQALLTLNRTVDASLARAFSGNLDHLDHLERLTARAEGRRNATLREFERHRGSPALRPRDNIRQLDDVEFEKIESGPIAPETASIKGPS
jgi:hypothetical protein